jgi:hypothetical protein
MKSEKKNKPLHSFQSRGCVNLKKMETSKTNRGYVNRGMEREFVSIFYPFVTSTKELFRHYDLVAHLKRYNP